VEIRESIISQYLAALEMLKKTIAVCPEELWHNQGEGNKFSQIAYHTLYYTHLYLEDSEKAFHPWWGHREEYRFGGGAPNEASGSAAKPVVLDYLAFCQQRVREKVSSMDLETASGFYWLKFTKFELQLYSIRHIQQHVGELMERLGPLAGEIDWVGSYRREVT
jgi:hypothetical protein